MGEGRQKLKAAVLYPSGEPPALSWSILEMARGYVSVEMNVLLSIRVFLAAQEWIGVVQVAVLTACGAKSSIRGLQDAYSPRTQCPHD